MWLRKNYCMNYRKDVAKRKREIERSAEEKRNGMNEESSRCPRCRRSKNGMNTMERMRVVREWIGSCIVVARVEDEEEQEEDGSGRWIQEKQTSWFA